MLSKPESVTLADMESNNVTPEEARVALESVDGIAQSVKRSPTPLWAYALVSSLFGFTVAMTILEWKYWWVAFILMIVVSVALAMYERNRAVRPSMKQPLQEDPQPNWVAAVAPVAILPLIWLVPEGSTVGAAIAGVVTAVVFTAILYYEGKRR
ncbi:hypothetical protein CGLAU_10055 [Corynebacterium glaucum]|uniref:Uncharacterized protein n=2 Tax=Corynebacterium glaucum TaxID=187491 RepID=A0A1Q2HYR2_9CORY|nr:hypothetical protein CGLAU_10055 [Corynebacterium glaucum]